MLTVDYDRLGVGAGTKVIDVGCGAGRHSYEAYRRGADVIAFDQNAEELAECIEAMEGCPTESIGHDGDTASNSGADEIDCLPSLPIA